MLTSGEGDLLNTRDQPSCRPGPGGPAECCVVLDLLAPLVALTAAVEVASRSAEEGGDVAQSGFCPKPEPILMGTGVKGECGAEERY